MNDEKARSENFGPFCLVSRKRDQFDRKVGDIREAVVLIVFIEALGKAWDLWH
tara:strand:- start:3195 stop:3353 length:159 start_codon:yes stop_codon:yes gene_type:complete